MKKPHILLLAILPALLLISWGFKGHQAVATIAEKHLTPKAKAAVAAVLGSQTMADVSTWADDVRGQSEYRSTGPWHYLNLPIGLNYASFEKTVNGMAGDNVYTAIAHARATLTSKDATHDQQLEALKFLVHLVGDAHQPMHVSRAEDKGGNTIQVQFQDKGTNLHTLWDSKLIDRQGLSVTEMATQYDKATSTEIKKWQQDEPLKWLYESYEISSQLYTEVEKSNKLGDDYYNAHISIIEHRIDQAGIRLAGVLNEIYK